VTAPKPAVPEPGYVALEAGGSRVEVVPTQGGRIRSLQLGGREWLLRVPGDAGPQPGQSPLAGAGWDECAPAAGAGTIPEWVKGCGGRPVPIGGEARQQVPEITLTTSDEGHQLSCVWRGDRLPWKLTRTLLVRPDGSIDARYEAFAGGKHRLPFLWSAHLLLPLNASTRLRFPEAARFRVSSVAGESAGVGATEGKWPRLVLDGRPRDLAQPWGVPRHVTVVGWLDLTSPRTHVAVEEEDARLAISTDGAGFPFLGVVIDRGGNGRAGKRRFGQRAQPVLALRPSLGAPDRYSEALGDWQSITWLVPGEARRWTMTFRAEHRPA
jgi:galactose mutarotase-like enzyme